MLTQVFRKYLVNCIKISYFLWFSPVVWNSARSKIEFVGEQKRRNVSQGQRVFFSLYVFGMVYHVVAGDAPADLKLQAMAIIPIFVVVLVLTWIWSRQISSLQLFNSLSKFEDYLVRGMYVSACDLVHKIENL